LPQLVETTAAQLPLLHDAALVWLHSIRPVQPQLGAWQVNVGKVHEARLLPSQNPPQLPEPPQAGRFCGAPLTALQVPPPHASH
jgi:hypothetical protein